MKTVSILATYSQTQILRFSIDKMCLHVKRFFAAINLKLTIDYDGMQMGSEIYHVIVSFRQKLHKFTFSNEFSILYLFMMDPLADKHSHPL